MPLRVRHSTFHAIGISNKYRCIVSPKFPEGTIAGLYKRAVAENQYQDAVRFGAQKINWTLKEFDVYNNHEIIPIIYRDTHLPSLLALLKTASLTAISLLCGLIRLTPLRFSLHRYQPNILFFN